MSQPHPPIPEPQPRTQDGTGSTAASADLPGAPSPGPRTQSILVPPSQQRAGEPAPQAEPFRTAQFPAVRDEQPSSDQLPTVGGAAPDVDPAGVDPAGVGRHSPPPVPGPVTAPVAASEPHPQTHPVSAPAQPAGDPPSTEPGAAHRAGARLAGVRRAAGGRGRRVLVSLALGVLALALLQIGLVLEDGSSSLWEVVPTWSTFATLAALVALVPAVVGLLGRGLPARTAWQVGAGGLAALGAFWVLVGLPLVVSDRGFWVTAALGAAAAAVWLAPGRAE